MIDALPARRVCIPYTGNGISDAKGMQPRTGENFTISDYYT